MSRRLVHVAQGSALVVIGGALLIRHLNGQTDKMMLELHHHLELIQAETKGRMDTRAEFAREAAGRRRWSLVRTARRTSCTRR